MAKSRINFVWIGPPKITQGGHDVIGIESIQRNYDKFFPESKESGCCSFWRSPKSDRNPLVFWCQSKYIKTYQKYFKEKSIVAKIESVDDYISKTGADHCLTVEKVYRDLLKAPLGGKTIRDRVTFKEIFSLFLLSTQGGYFLDSNIQAMDDKPVNFSEHSQFRFPAIRSESSLEVWMLYCPLNDKRRARKSLKYFLDNYLICEQQYRKNYNLEQYHKNLGRLVVDAVCLGDQRAYLVENHPNTWACSNFSAAQTNVPTHNLIKVYYNTHKPHQEHAYSSAHYDAMHGKTERLKFHLDHGINVNLTANANSKGHPDMTYESWNETLLHGAVSCANSPEHVATVKLLLEYGANINAIYLMRRRNKPMFHRTALFDAVDNKNQDVLEELLKHNPDLALIINNESVLSFAVRKNFGVKTLLEHKADPNQVWQKQNDTPLCAAIRAENYDNVRTLLEYKSNPDFKIGKNDYGHFAIHAFTALHIALYLKNAGIVALLLESGADIDAEFEEQKTFSQPRKLTARTLPTSEECKLLVEARANTFSRSASP